MRLLLVPLLLLWPLAEIAGFVVVGRAMGLWVTLCLVIGTALVGALLLRHQGMHILKQISAESRQGRMPGKSLGDGAMIVIAGILLLLPGFLTDLIGLLLFVPAVRRLLWSQIASRVIVVRSQTGNYHYQAGGRAPEGRHTPDKIVELDEQDFHREPNPDSPWAGSDRREP